MFLPSFDNISQFKSKISTIHLSQVWSGGTTFHPWWQIVAKTHFNCCETLPNTRMKHLHKSIACSIVSKRCTYLAHSFLIRKTSDIKHCLAVFEMFMTIAYSSQTLNPQSFNTICCDSYPILFCELFNNCSLVHLYCSNTTVLALSNSCGNF